MDRLSFDRFEFVVSRNLDGQRERERERERISTARAFIPRPFYDTEMDEDRRSLVRQSVGIRIRSTKKRRVHRMEALSGRKVAEDTADSTVATVLIYRRGFLVEAIPHV